MHPTVTLLRLSSFSNLLIRADPARRQDACADKLQVDAAREHAFMPLENQQSPFLSAHCFLVKRPQTCERLVIQASVGNSLAGTDMLTRYGLNPDTYRTTAWSIAWN